MNFSLFFTAW